MSNEEQAMSERSGWQTVESLPISDTGEGIVGDLFAWGELFEALATQLSPLCQLEDLLLPDHPWKTTQDPMSAFVRGFGRDSIGQAFLQWWVGEDALLPAPNDSSSWDVEIWPSEQQDHLHKVEQAGEAGFKIFTSEWNLEPHRLTPKTKTPVGVDREIRLSLDSKLWNRICPKLALQDLEPSPSASVPSLDQAIARVRSFFEPLESPFFGMDAEMLVQHVKETIPKEVLGSKVTQIIPLFGEHHRQQNFAAVAQLPTHLRVILRRLEKAQSNDEVVSALLATLESVDFTLRFSTGLAQGCWAAVTQSELPGPFEPTTADLISGLGQVTRGLQAYWDHPHAQPALHLFFRGRDLHPFLRWAGFEAEPRLLSWMLDAEEAVRTDNPGRCLALANEIMESFNQWIEDFVLLCSTWDVVIAARQDGYLGISIARGAVALDLKPLIDPTRYSVWLDRSELTAIDNQWSKSEPPRRLERLDSRIMLCSNDPPFLSEQIGLLLRAHDEGEVLPLGRSLFCGLEYLVRLHASLAGAYLFHHFEEATILDPVLKPGGALARAIFFLSYSQRILRKLDTPEAKLLSGVFFDNGQPRTITRWLGIASGVPGPLQGLIGWSLSLMRPDVGNRLEEIRGQIPRFSGLFAEFIEASRYLWSSARLQIAAGPENSQVTVCQFPSGLRLRGVPDIVVGHRVESNPPGVVVGGIPSEDRFEHWESTEIEPAEVGVAREPIPRQEETVWPSFFEDDPEDEAAAPTWEPELLQELEVRCRDLSFSRSHDRPIELAQEIASFILGSGVAGSTLSFVRGDRGSGRTFLCRTLAHSAFSPLGKDFPVLYLKVDRFPQTRLSTVVERLNDHIASESSLDRFDWVPVPNETLQSLGYEVDRLSGDLAELGQGAAPLANRLSSYLRCLKKLNDGRNFLLMLDGFEAVPASIIAQVLSPGIHLLITGSSLPEDQRESLYLEHRYWDLSQDKNAALAFSAQVRELELDSSQERIAFHRLEGSLLKARAFVNLKENDDNLSPQPNVLEEVLAFGRRIFPEPDRRATFFELLCTLGLYDRPVPLRHLSTLGLDAEVVNVATHTLPSLFSFWAEPDASLGLSHRLVFEALLESGGMLERVADRLTREFLTNPRRGELMPALQWLSYSGASAELIEQFFASPEVVGLWREELSSLWSQGLFFQRVALLDATEEPLLSAIDGGAGHLREELGWLHNARGLSLLKLGLLQDAGEDLEVALAQFQTQFASGEIELMASVGSATNRLSEVALKRGDLRRAHNLCRSAMDVLEEARAINDTVALRTFMARTWIQEARINLRIGDSAQALEATQAAHDLLSSQPHENVASLLAEVGWYRAEALAGTGETELSLRELEPTIEQLFATHMIEDGLQALLLRARLLELDPRSGKAAYDDLDRALSILRYRVFTGRIDLEPMLAYTAARRSLTKHGDPHAEARNLTEFVDWARQAVRLEGRSDLRALLAYLLMARGTCWKELGYFAKAVTDLRAATEQYDLLAAHVEKSDSEAVWSGLWNAFTQLASLYLSLDEAPLATLAGRRALDLAQRTTRDRPLVELGLEVPNFSLVAPSSENRKGQAFDTELYQTAKLFFHLGEATRRLQMEKLARAYFEQAAQGFEQLLETSPSSSPTRLEEYRVVLKYVAKSAEVRRDMESLDHWVAKLENLPHQVLGDFDRYGIHSWKGRILSSRGNLTGALTEFQAAMSVLEALSKHPRASSLQAEALLEIGRCLSLQGRHDEALEQLERAAMSSQDSLFDEGEENRELLIRCSFALAVAHLRAGRRDEALERLLILISYRPKGRISELVQLADDWVATWQKVEPLAAEELVVQLAQMCALGDWLSRTPLGLWFRELVTELVTKPNFLELTWNCAQLDTIIETFLVVTFSQITTDSVSPLHRGTSVSETGELQRLLKAKVTSLEADGRLVEAELMVSHLIPLRAATSTGHLLMERSQMALRRGDRGVAIVDLLRASEQRGKSKVLAHLRLTEFLLSRELQAAAALHLKRALFSVDEMLDDLPSLLRQVHTLMTSMTRSGATLEPGILEEYLRIACRITEPADRTTIELNWLKSLGNYRDWTPLTEAAIAFLSHRHTAGAADEVDWHFLDQVLERTLLATGGLGPLMLRDLGDLLGLSWAQEDFDPTLTPLREKVWNRFVQLLPLLGRPQALALMRRLFQFVSGKVGAWTNDRAATFLEKLNAEIRLLSQPF